MDDGATGTTTARLAVDGLRVEFPGRRGTVVASRNVTLAVRAGEILGVVGESGAGKSTIGNAVMKLLEPPGRVAAGTVTLAGARIDGLEGEAMRRIRGKRIAMIFQDPQTSLNPLETVGRQLEQTMLTHLDIGPADARSRAVALLGRGGIPDPDRRVAQYPHQFSGGMRQRVVIALALCAQPDVIIADEPTTALDVTIQAQILELMRRLVRDTGVGMVLITHDMGVIAETADRVAVMYKGEVGETGPTAKILKTPDHPYTKSLIAAVPRADRRLTRFPTVDYIEAAGTPRTAIDLTDHWLGRAMAEYPPLDGPLLEVRGLSKSFRSGGLFGGGRDEVRAVDAVSFAIRPGETFGLVGESGSGKSTMARLITGIHTPTAGRVLFAGADLTGLKTRRAIAPYRRQMQMIFQDPYSSLNARMRVGAIVAEPIRFHRLASSRAETEAIVGDLLDQVGLGAAAARKYPHEFSGGQRQRISIARALATRPRFQV